MKDAWKPYTVLATGALLIYYYLGQGVIQTRVSKRKDNGSKLMEEEPGFGIKREKPETHTR